MTVARRILVEIVLMIFLGAEVVLQGQFLDSKRLLVELLLLAVHLFDNRQVLGRSIVNARAIACPLVVTLLVETCRVDGLEEHLQ